MQDLKALEGKSLAELHEIAKALGIEDVMVKKRELIEKITGGSAQETSAENKGKRGRKKETPAAETPAVTTPETAVAEAAAKTAETSAAEPEPMAAAAPLLLIAYYTSVLKGNDVDKPRNLAKSVTVE